MEQLPKPKDHRIETKSNLNKSINYTKVQN